MPRLVKRDRRGDELLVQRAYVTPRPCWCCTAPITTGRFCLPCRTEHGAKLPGKDARWESTCPHARAAEAARAERIKAMPASRPLAVSDSARDRVAAYEV